MKYEKIIIWGAKLDTGHTHSFIHLAFARAAASMGIETYWVDNRDDLDDTFFDNSLIVSEQWHVFENGTSNRLPLRKSSCYIINYVGNKGATPENQFNPGASHYLGKVGKLIDFRFACDWGINGIEDKNYAYKFEKEKYIELGSGTAYLEKGSYYNKFYAIWGTDLLPEEIDFNNRFHPHTEPKFAFFGGTISPPQGWGNPEDSNYFFFDEFVRECQKVNFPFHYNDPRQNPLDTSALQRLVLDSYVPIDLRPKNHLANGYIPCRSLKNASYGQLVVTNSKAVHDYLDGRTAYHPDPAALLHVAIEMQNDPKTKDMILSVMETVKQKHTYVSKIKDMIEASEID